MSDKEITKEIKIVYLQHVDELHRNQNGVTQLYFYTEVDGKIFWGTDNNSIDPENIQQWLSEGKIFRFKEPLVINNNEVLYIDYVNLKVYSKCSTQKEYKSIGILKNLIK